MPSTNSCFDLLREYFAGSHDLDWALATVVFKEGSSYRSPGALMLVNSLGKTFGLVSGGCLESDIVRRAGKVFASKKAEYVEYDMLEEDSFASGLGIGCNGKIGILIQPITAAVRDLLKRLHQRMTDNLNSRVLQVYRSNNAEQLNSLGLFDDAGQLLATSTPALCASVLPAGPWPPHLNFSDQQNRYSLSLLPAPVNLWVFGGGIDAVPLVRMAAQLGWRVTVADHRTAYARVSEFEQAERIIKLRPEEFLELEQNRVMDAAIVMTHNLKLDARWLDVIGRCYRPRYVGLLGPSDRKRRVGELMQTDAVNWFENDVHGPAGLDIGGELPESIALSILSQCHQALMLERTG